MSAASRVALTILALGALLTEVIGVASTGAGANGTNATVLSEPHAAHAEHGTAHLSLAFLFLALMLGAVTEYLTSRHCHSLPYTCTLLVEGIFIGAWYGWPSSSASAQR